jgi:threonylcarbamoyladenosine tRNA methylthiotransferase MtaB
MPHLHLSLQSGDDLILKRMKRRHSRDQAIAFCADLRAARPDFAFGADLIAGFPTETEAMFENSLRLVEECGLAFLHVFPYSPRRGTPAARLPQVAKPEIKARAARLRAAGATALARHLAGHVGREGVILVERAGIGRLDDFTPVRFSGGAEPGTLARFRVTGHDGAMLAGVPLPEPGAIAAE